MKKLTDSRDGWRLAQSNVGFDRVFKPNARLAICNWQLPYLADIVHSHRKFL